jgi:hypothetical protein
MIAIAYGHLKSNRTIRGGARIRLSCGADETVLALFTARRRYPRHLQGRALGLRATSDALAGH